MTSTKPLSTQTKRFEHWMINSALPLWVSRGINPNNNSAYERLKPNGLPDLQSTSRSRVQARQVFVFAAAHRMGWLNNALPVISGIECFLNNNARVKGPGYVHLLDADGQVIDGKKDAYDFAFFILACAYKYQTFGDQAALLQIESLTAHLDTEFKRHSGGWLEGDYPAPYRRQNPHMHLFEAFLSCYEATGKAKWLAKAGQIFSLFETIFFDHHKGVVREYFEADWSIAKDGASDRVEPGHMFEWVWLLRWYQKLTGVPVDDYCNQLFSKAITLGVEPRTGLIYDEVNEHGRVLKASKRCWPLTEMIKASLAQAEVAAAEKVSFYESYATVAIGLLFDYYLIDNVTGSDNYLHVLNDNQQALNCPTKQIAVGAYIDQLDENNRISEAHAPASTLYHISMAAIVAVNYAQRK